MVQVMWSEGAWVVNVGVEGTNGATRGLSMGIDGLGGEVNDASGADEMGGQFLHVLGCRGLDYGMWGQ